MDPILEILHNNARLSSAEIGEMLQLSTEEVNLRIKKLETDKVILRYSAILNNSKIPSKLNKVQALIEVEVRPERGTGFDSIAERIYKFPEVVSCYLMSGGYDLLIQVEGDTLQDVAAFISNKLSTIEHVRGTATHFLLKKYKDHGQILIEQAKDTRLPVAG